MDFSRSPTRSMVCKIRMFDSFSQVFAGSLPDHEPQRETSPQQEVAPRSCSCMVPCCPLSLLVDFLFAPCSYPILQHFVFAKTVDCANVHCPRTSQSDLTGWRQV